MEVLCFPSIPRIIDYNVSPMTLKSQGRGRAEQQLFSRLGNHRDDYFILYIQSLHVVQTVTKHTTSFNTFYIAHGDLFIATFTMTSDICLHPHLHHFSIPLIITIFCDSTLHSFSPNSHHTDRLKCSTVILVWCVAPGAATVSTTIATTGRVAAPIASTVVSSSTVATSPSGRAAASTATTSCHARQIGAFWDNLLDVSHELADRCIFGRFDLEITSPKHALIEN